MVKWHDKRTKYYLKKIAKMCGLDHPSAFHSRNPQRDGTGGESTCHQDKTVWNFRCSDGRDLGRTKWHATTIVRKVGRLRKKLESIKGTGQLSHSSSQGLG